MKFSKPIALLAIVTLLLCACAPSANVPASDSANPGTAASGEEPAPAEDYADAQSILDLGNSLSLLRVFSYAGLYVEDGTDDAVSDVCSILVRNDGEKTVQYAHIVLTAGEATFDFDLSTLPAGETVQLLELSRKSAPGTSESLSGSVTSYAVFESEPSMCEDIFRVETQNTAITLTNLSDSDITGQIYVYYKNVSGGLYIGGITYRVGINGLKAGESTTGYAGHFTADGSRLLFVTYVP